MAKAAVLFPSAFGFTSEFGFGFGSEVSNLSACRRLGPHYAWRHQIVKSGAKSEQTAPKVPAEKSVLPEGAVAIRVKMLNGEMLMEIVIDRKRTIRRLKNQIEGIQGMPASNQTLLLDGRALNDAATLENSGITSMAELTLVPCAPLLTGRLSREEFQVLLEDTDALEEAIDAYKSHLDYSSTELNTIVAAVCNTLVPNDHDLANEILHQLPLHVLADGNVLACDVDSEFGCDFPGETIHYDIGQDLPVSREAAKENFRLCLKAAFDVLAFALGEKS